MFSQKHLRKPSHEHKEREPPVPGHCSAAAVCLLFCSSAHQQPKAVQEEAEVPVLPGFFSNLPLAALLRSLQTEKKNCTPSTGSVPGGALRHNGSKNLEFSGSFPGGCISA